MQEMKTFSQMPDREDIERLWPRICDWFHRRKQSTALTDHTPCPLDEYLQAGWWQEEWLKFEAAGDVKANQKVGMFQKDCSLSQQGLPPASK
eukprot:3486540-Rhodomonas_salina.1